MQKSNSGKVFTVSPIPGLTISASTEWMLKNMTSEFQQKRPETGCSYDDGLTSVDTLAKKASHLEIQQ